MTCRNWNNSMKMSVKEAIEKHGVKKLLEMEIFYNGEIRYLNAVYHDELVNKFAIITNRMDLFVNEEIIDLLEQ